jgi:competence ComEA-like helix-hairpin-helix protein
VWTLTPAERRGLEIVALLFAIGALDDLWRASHPRFAAERGGAADPGGGTTPRAVPTAGAAPGRPVDSTRDPARVDLNRATAAELDALPGIGPVLARRIVEHRERFGPFRRVPDLLDVPGIGPKLYAKLEGRVAIIEPFHPDARP